jgi:hypothetical protein
VSTQLLVLTVQLRPAALLHFLPTSELELYILKYSLTIFNFPLSGNHKKVEQFFCFFSSFHRFEAMHALIVVVVFKHTACKLSTDPVQPVIRQSILKNIS